MFAEHIIWLTERCDETEKTQLWVAGSLAIRMEALPKGQHLRAYI